MRPMRPMLLGVAAAAAAVLIAPRPAAAQQADVPALIQLVQEQPAGMDRATWKDRRRDAARKLVHPTQHRGLSLREASRLQSLPDWFRFSGNAAGDEGGLVHKQQQLANAVCPLVAKAIADYLLRL